MNRVELLEEMNSIVKEQVKHYDSDFMLDIDFMYTTSDKKFIWIVRKYGTNIVSLWPGKDFNSTKEYNDYIHISKVTLNSFYEEHKKTSISHKFFIIDLEHNTIKRIYGKTIENFID